MSTGGWSTLSTGFSSAGGWGSRPAQAGDEALFQSLSPINGMVTGEQVKSVFESSGLTKTRLAQIWSSVDQDRDGRINLSQFLMAMTLIRQAKKESLQSSLPASGFANFQSPSKDSLSKSFASPSLSIQQTTPHGVGVGVSMSTVKEGWALKPQDKRKYVMQFNTLDKNKTGFLSGSEAGPILARSELKKDVLAAIWQLADLDKDGRLSCDEFVIAVHLTEKVKFGLTLPRTLPPELFPGPTKYATVDRRTTTPHRADKTLEKRSSVIDPADWASRQSTSTEDTGLSFEDKRKENFEAGRMELERRRKALQEEQERIAAEKERKRREEEERRLQQEREAELARQAELERQRQKALEIERERERQMQKLALQREAEQRELERKRKEEWARKRQAELEGERTKERSSLAILKDQHAQLEHELLVLNQRKMGAQASVERQRVACVEISKIIRTLVLSRDVRLEELRKAQGELNSLQARVSSLHQQRGALQASLEQRSSGSGYQANRQRLNDQVIGLAALMAGLRASLSHNTEESEKLKASFIQHQQTLEGLTSTCRSEEVKNSQLRIIVKTRKQAWEEKQRNEQEERERKAAEDRRIREEQEKIQREIEERAKREERLAKIKRDQEMARKKAAIDSVMADLSAASSPHATPPLMASPKATPPVAKKPTPPTSAPVPTKRNKKEEAAKDKEVLKKVQELQARKQELQKQKEQTKDTPAKKHSSGAPPIKPAPYSAHKNKNTKPWFGFGSKQQQQSPDKKDTPTSSNLLDLVSSWDSSTGTIVGIRHFKQDPKQMLKPVKPREATLTEETTPSPVDHVVVSPNLDGSVEVIPLENFEQQISDESSIYAVPRSLAQRKVSSEGTPSSEKGQSSTTSEVKPSGGTPSSDKGQGSTTSEVKPEPVHYQAIFAYETSDPSELNLQEGDMVTSDPTIEAPPGWLMVGRPSGETGWAPLSYLHSLPEEAKVEREVPAPSEERVVSPPTQMAVVLFSWQGSKDNHLSITKGERIGILQQGDKWWSGEKGGKAGWFPRTFVKLEESKEEKTTPEPASTETGDLYNTIDETALSQPAAESTHQNTPNNVYEAIDETPAPPKGQVYEAIYDYDCIAEGDLSFKAGDAIEVTSTEGVWWTGTLNGVTGNFPSNYVQPRYDAPSTQSQDSHSTAYLAPSKHHTESQGAVETLTKPLVAKVVVAFQAQQDGQLSLSPGDLIKVSKRASNGWWEGELQARGRQRVRGWFPANRVELLGQKKHSSTSPMSSRAKSPLLEVLEDTPSGGGSENLVLALYTYEAQSTDELSFHKGSVLTVLSKDGDWWRGELNRETGLFPSNYVQPLMEQQASTSDPTRWADSVSSEVLAAVTDQERKRQETIFELVTSERYYTDSLKMVKEIFFDPMKEAHVLTEEEMGKVVVNWDDLIRCSSDLLKAFLVRLRTSGAVVRNVGDVLANQIPELTPHIRWCSCQLNACTLLQQKSSDPQFREFEQKCMKDTRTGGLPLSSFLLKPMQRVTKYPLLIKRILDYTPKEDMDYSDLQQALERAEKLCDQVNEAVRHKENTEKLEWLQTHIQFTLDEKLVFNSATNFMGSRRLLHWGKLFKIRGAKDVLAFLFNDFLLMVKPKLFFPRAATTADLEPFGKNEFQMYRQPFLLEGLRVKIAPEDQHGPSVFLLFHSSEEKDIPLRADSDHKRDQWVKLITRAGLEYITTKKRMEREKKELRMRTMKDSVGFLKVTVVEASDLVAKDPNGKSDPFCVMTLGGQQEQTTPTVPLSLNPKWNCQMEFYVHDINTDVLEVTVFDKDLFSPNDFLGCAKVSLQDLLRDGDSPWTKRLLLEDVARGEIELKIELELKASDLLL